MKSASPTITEAAARKEIEILRRLGPLGRLEAACELFDFAREFLTVNFRADHPDWSEDEVQEAVRQRILDSQ